MADRVGTGPISYWHDSLSTGDELTARAALPGDRAADVVIVGAGFTGLWTAHSLLRLDPGLRVVVLERETAGFGATVHPARLARGLAAEVERLGGVVHEQTRVRSIRERQVLTDHGTVRADVVVRCTEAYTRSIESYERDVVPLANHVIATEPIDESTWAEIGLADRQLFELNRVLLGYGHRTGDGRIVWGGLAAPSRWGSRIPPSPWSDPRVVERLRNTLERLFPPLTGIGVTHAWSGVLGVPRDLLPGIGLDRATGFAWAGGYTGQGVAAANAAGRGLADLILDRDSDLVQLPWVGHRSRRWEPEPVRWLGIHSVTTAGRVSDAFEAIRG
jgi:glycine/D-amino acid oxidase-like deaminating enzyme